MDMSKIMLVSIVRKVFPSLLYPSHPPTKEIARNLMAAGLSED